MTEISKEEFEKKVKSGEITSYDQFPNNVWGFGALVGLSFQRETEIFNEVKALAMAMGTSKDFATSIFNLSKDLINVGREPEAMVYVFWMGKIVGLAQKQIVLESIKKLSEGGFEGGF